MFVCISPFHLPCAVASLCPQCRHQAISQPASKGSCLLQSLSLIPNFPFRSHNFCCKSFPKSFKSFSCSLSLFPEPVLSVRAYFAFMCLHITTTVMQHKYTGLLTSCSIACQIDIMVIKILSILHYINIQMCSKVYLHSSWLWIFSNPTL